MVLDFQIKHREGSEDNGIVVHESYSSDFMIDGKSLLAELVSKAGGHGDFLGCFARDWDNLNKHSLKQLLLQEPPETESGRSLIYVCPECADIGCGAYGCKITKVDDEYIWNDFAYENGYEDPDPIKEIGPFKFSATEYESVVKRAFSL
ncbi:hypothetical protein BEL05_20410 [Shewanella colwelliana]|uniref:Uncharacterized protein n=1 Tax=Shewanella colwelliana TaxID=23 RepID=A0A1E5IU43_SHECO|nr:hypothetical protein BEL05_20410 [Shewanella colwelliana]